MGHVAKSSQFPSKHNIRLLKATTAAVALSSIAMPSWMYASSQYSANKADKALQRDPNNEALKEEVLITKALVELNKQPNAIASNALSGASAALLGSVLGIISGTAVRKIMNNENTRAELIENAIER